MKPAADSTLTIRKPGPYVDLTTVSRWEGPRAVLSLKRSGDMSQLKQREVFLESIGVEPSRAFFLKQIHSRKVIYLDDNRDAFQNRWSGSPPEGDGLVTEDPRAVLCVSVADCLPLFLFDESSGALGLLHSGWKGTGIVEVGVRMMRERGSVGGPHPAHGARTDMLKALLGPCIGPCCYRIPRDRYELFERDYGAEAVARDKGDHYIDLRAANQVLRHRLGVKNVSVISACTACNPLLSSFRRDGKGFSGMLAVTGYF